MTNAEILTLVVSIVSFGFAIYSWCISHHVNKKMLEIEEKREQDRLTEHNTGKVKIIATKSPPMIYITNKGPVDITITDIVLNGFPIQQNPCIKPGSFPQAGIKLPINNQYPIEMSFGRGAEKVFLPPYDTIVKWVTEKGENQQTAITINWL